ncbi:MAG: hypothetical protein H0S85_15600 [Desulfovibrionaceae bacterium]|jgi:hypothetical protein|nr:hypothetical protein [Desulfovibrionaceae bacterium]
MDGTTKADPARGMTDGKGTGQTTQGARKGWTVELAHEAPLDWRASLEGLSRRMDGLVAVCADGVCRDLDLDEVPVEAVPTAWDGVLGTLDELGALIRSAYPRLG